MKILPLIKLTFGFALISTSAMAETLTYQPPPRKEQQQQAISSASRGCRRKLPKMQLLAPLDHIAMMGEEKTFLLNLSELPPFPLQLSVLEPYVPESVWEDQVKVKKSGFLPISLPDNINLDPNKDYIFTVVIPCDEDSPSHSSYVRVLFQKSSNQYQKEEPLKQISRLLAGGIWYDALWIAYFHQLPQFKQILEKQGIEMEK